VSNDATARDRMARSIGRVLEGETALHRAVLALGALATALLAIGTMAAPPLRSIRSESSRTAVDGPAQALGSGDEREASERSAVARSTTAGE
jgi:hypothetical protein